MSDLAWPGESKALLFLLLKELKGSVSKDRTLLLMACVETRP